VDAIEVEADADTAVVCAFGDSITDGVNSTLNGSDTWPDQLSRRLHKAYGNKISVVNEAISGNTVNSDRPGGTSVNGPSAVDRLDRDLFGVAGLHSDAVADFDAATLDPATGALKPPFQPNVTTGGAGDLLRPNRAGLQAMAQTIDIKLLAPGPRE
jgi:lysophospholipase L1-like esterase